MQQQQQKNDDLSQMVAEAKQYAETVTPQGLEWFDTYNKRFAKLVAQKEREACFDAAMKAAEAAIDAAIALEREECAKVCETRLGPTATDFYGKTYAEAIRARGGNE